MQQHRAICTANAQAAPRIKITMTKKLRVSRTCTAGKCFVVALTPDTEVLGCQQRTLGAPAPALSFRPILTRRRAVPVEWPCGLLTAGQDNVLTTAHHPELGMPCGHKRLGGVFHGESLSFLTLACWLLSEAPCCRCAILVELCCGCQRSNVRESCDSQNACGFSQ